MTDIVITFRDTAANLATSNPTIPLGEGGLETDTGLIKHGNGSTSWIDLNYFVQPFLSTPATLADVHAVVEDHIVNGITDLAPSENSVFDALALKADISSMVVKATGAEVDTGTNDTKFVTAKALKDSYNIPDVAPGASGHVITSNGTNWTSAVPAASGATNIDGLTDAIANATSVYLGSGSGVGATTGTVNTAVGVNAMPNAGDSSANNAFGNGALFALVDGGNNQNSAFGDSSLNALTIGNHNTAVGHLAGSAQGTGNFNTYVGTDSNTNSAASTNRTALGYAATCTANNTVQIGNTSVTNVTFGNASAVLHADGSALTGITSGATSIDELSDAKTEYSDSNMFLGQGVGAAETTSTFTTILGAGAGTGILTNANNTGLGAGVLAILTSGAQNVAVGAAALASGTIAHENVAVGYNTLNGLIAGGGNVAIGSNAGFNVTGQRNILIGRSANTYTPSAVDIIALGDNVTGNAEKTFVIGPIGTKQAIYEGANAAMGVSTLSGGAVTVSNTLVTANSRIFLAIQSLGTVVVPTIVGVTARSAGTSFTITSANAVDTSVIAWEIKEPN